MDIPPAHIFKVRLHFFHFWYESFTIIPIVLSLLVTISLPTSKIVCVFLPVSFLYSSPTFLYQSHSIPLIFPYFFLSRPRGFIEFRFSCILSRYRMNTLVFPMKGHPSLILISLPYSYHDLVCFCAVSLPSLTLPFSCYFVVMSFISHPEMAYEDVTKMSRRCHEDVTKMSRPQHYFVKWK